MEDCKSGEGDYGVVVDRLTGGKPSLIYRTTNFFRANCIPLSIRFDLIEIVFQLAAFTMESNNIWWSLLRRQNSALQRPSLDRVICFMFRNHLWPCLVFKNFQDSLSHQMLGHMYRALNIDRKK
jgi:hypothetical protein